MPRSIPKLTDAEIRKIAEETLRQYQPEAGIPIPIEEMIEFDLGMEIRPVRGLWVLAQIEGALTADLQTILVDEERMDRYVNRYHFTLAHELGHRILHEDFLTSFAFEDREGWKQKIRAIDPATYGRMERQAFLFAGYLLIPLDSLRLSCQEAQQKALQRGIDLRTMGYDGIERVAGSIAKDYGVSTEAMTYQILKERLFRDEET